MSKQLTKHPVVGFSSYLQISFAISIILALGSIFYWHAHVLAQEEELWAGPVNLSQSGAATEPRIVIDSDGGLHVLWREDAVNGFYYTYSRDGLIWQRATSVELPFATRRYDDISEDEAVPLYDPELVADNVGRIHAFWQDEDRSLYYGSVLASEFDNFESWSERQLLGASVLGYSAASDSGNRIHVGYVSSADSQETPAGIYYRGLSADGGEWSEPEEVYRSAYFRAADPESVNIHIEAGEITDDTSSVFIVFDNQSLEEVYFARSSNSGETWPGPIIIDQRLEEDSPTSSGPSSIDVVSAGGELHLTWLAGHDTSCSQYHRLSEDDGHTWQPGEVVALNNGDCPVDYQLLRSSDGRLFRLADAVDGAFLQMWNGMEWSKNERQLILGGFDDPVTHRQLSLGCRRAVVGADDSLFIVGCGTSEGNEDIWLLERPLGEEEYWFPIEPTIWSEPSLLMSTTEELSVPLLLSSSGELLHAFWLENVVNESESETARIYYSSWKDGNWSRNVPLINLDTAQADQLSGLMVPNEGPILIWRDQASNTYFTSTASSDRILIPADWSLPQIVFEPKALVGHPELFLDRNEVVNLIYALPLNEGRGIYLKSTEDYGRTWSEPLVVVDAVAAEWAMVDYPAIAQTTDGSLHVVFSVYSLEPGPVIQGLYYTRSTDGGNTWSDPELVVGGDIQSGQVFSVESETVLIAWQAPEFAGVQWWSQVTDDGGITWERPELVLEPTPAFTSHSFGAQIPNELYLVQMQADADGNLTLQERRWREDAWQEMETHDLRTRLEDVNLFGITSAVMESGQLMTLLSTVPAFREQQAEANGFVVVDSQKFEETMIGDGEAESALLFSHRSVELPEYFISNEPPSETVSEPRPVVVMTEEEPVETSEIAPDETEDGRDFEMGEISAGGESTSVTNGIAMGVAPAVLIVVVIFAIAMIRLRPGR